MNLDWKSPHNRPYFGIFNALLSTQIVNVARFARNVECDFFCDFQTLCSRASSYIAKCWKQMQSTCKHSR